MGLRVLMWSAWAHPRRCGADGWDELAERLVDGSSPQVRGRLFLDDLGQVCFRLIPAGAGQTRGRCLLARRGRAHPRRCGADDRVLAIARGERGSSPQVRGRRVACQQPVGAVGLIPAGAGQTFTTNKYSKTRWAHPRRCGADLVLGGELLAHLGSSPQVRGRRR